MKDAEAPFNVLGDDTKKLRTLSKKVTIFFLTGYAGYIGYSIMQPVAQNNAKRMTMERVNVSIPVYRE